MNSNRVIVAMIVLFGAGLIGRQITYYAGQSVEINPQMKAVMNGVASWYSMKDRDIKKTTANNEIFNDTEHTAAMWGVPFNQKVKVTNKANGKSVIVRVNDRGPHKRLVRRGRVIDLSKSAFAEIASLRTGLIDIELEFL